jgi:hypothetical protein
VDAFGSLRTGAASFKSIQRQRAIRSLLQGEMEQTKTELVERGRMFSRTGILVDSTSSSELSKRWYKVKKNQEARRLLRRSTIRRGEFKRSHRKLAAQAETVRCKRYLKRESAKQSVDTAMQNFFSW